MEKNERLKFIQNRLQEHYDEACSLGFEVIGVWLQGSQNYNLDCYDKDYQSDIDTKCVILPSFDDVVRGAAPYSYTHVRANNEHIDIKDIRVMLDMFKKQNAAYIEILFTDFFIINPKYADLVDEFMEHAEEIAHLNENQALRCLAGMSMEKYRALEHPYPTIKAKIDKFGYDPKQLHHIIRINELMSKYITGKPYKECLQPDNVELLLAIKKGCYSLTQARELALKYDSLNKALKETNLKDPEPVDAHTVQLLNDVRVDFMKRFLKEELLKEDKIGE